MRLLALITFMTFSSLSLSYEGSPTEQVNLFFSDLSAGKVNESIDGLYASNPLMQQKIQALTMLKQQLGSVGALYGDIIGNENISTEKLSPSITRIVQAAKHDAHPVIWEFYFYKPKGKWIISQAMFVDQFQTVGAKQ
jgi:hypothetical protein